MLTADLALFLITVLAASWLLRPRPRAWRVMLVAASAVFYLDPRQHVPDPRLLAVIVAMVAVAHVLLRAAGSPTPWTAPVAVSVVVVGIVVVVTGAFPAAEDARGRGLAVLTGLVLAGQAFALAVHDAGARRRVLQAAGIAVVVAGGAAAEVTAASGGGVVAVLGLAFLVLAVVSYVVDVGRRDQRPVSLLDALVHHTFFPRLLAGPVVRVGELVPQLAERPDPRHVATGEAFELIIRGLVKKVVVSGYLAAQLTDPVLAAPGGSSRLEVAVAIVAYAVQVYADVSGYLDLATGVALLLGIRFPANFDRPFRAGSLVDFWSRWNLTLTRWFRDYVYRPAGGGGAALLLTAVAGALWHGPRLTFLVWAGLHAGGILVERRVAAARPGLVGRLPWGLATFALVSVAWVFFGARDAAAALAVLGQLVTGGGATTRVTPAVVAVIAGAIAVQLVPSTASRRAVAALTATPPAVQLALGALALLAVRALAPEHLAPFLYVRS